MKTPSKTENSYPAKIQFTASDVAVIKALDCASVRFLNEDELVDVLHQRMGKSKSEARALIEFYTHPIINPL